MSTARRNRCAGGENKRQGYYCTWSLCTSSLLCYPTSSLASLHFFDSETLCNVALISPISLSCSHPGNLASTDSTPRPALPQAPFSPRLPRLTPPGTSERRGEKCCVTNTPDAKKHRRTQIPVEFMVQSMRFYLTSYSELKNVYKK